MIFLRFEPYVDDRYRDKLRNEGKAEQLADVDIIAALDMYVERGQWDKAIATAQQQVLLCVYNKNLIQLCLVHRNDV